MTVPMRRTFRALAAVLLVLAGGLVAAVPASSSQPLVATMTGIRTGQHPGYDRVVLDMSGPAPSVSYQLVDELIQDGSGDVVWLTGEHFINVTVTPAYAHDAAGNRSFPGPDRFRTRDLRNVMAVALTGDFEATVAIGLGVRYRSWVRVFTLTSPTRVVIDVGS